MTYAAKLKRLGGSHFVRIPMKMVKSLGLKPQDVVQVALNKPSLIMKYEVICPVCGLSFCAEPNEGLICCQGCGLETETEKFKITEKL